MPLNKACGCCVRATSETCARWKFLAVTGKIFDPEKFVMEPRTLRAAPRVLGTQTRPVRARTSKMRTISPNPPLG
jgi:hypothetical protein